MDLQGFLLIMLLLFLSYPSYAATSKEEHGFLKTCSPQRCHRHGPEIRFPFRLSSYPASCGAPGMKLSCSGHETILDHPVLGPCKVTAIYYRHRVMTAIPLEGSSSNCPLQKLISGDQLTDVYTSPVPVGVLVGCSRVAINQDGIAGPSSCLSLSNNASQFWYLVEPDTDMSTLPMGCEVVAKGIPVPYTYDKIGPEYETFFGRSLFNEKAKRAINFGETAFNW